MQEEGNDSALGLDGLSPRLRQTLVHLLEGASEKEIAAQLGLSLATTHQYVMALYRHFGVRSRGQLISHLLHHLLPGFWQEMLQAFGSACDKSRPLAPPRARYSSLRGSK